MDFVPLMSLFIAITSSVIAWHKRAAFEARPYFFWFVYFQLAAVGLHEFEEYGFPGHFREAFVGVFGTERANELVPSVTTLELLNSLVLINVFGLVGWVGTRIVWVGLAVLFINFGNGFFHLIESVIHMKYVPGAVTGTLLYLPLGLLAMHFAVVRGDIDRSRLLLAFSVGTAGSFIPFLYIWLLHWLA